MKRKCVDYCVVPHRQWGGGLKSNTLQDDTTEVGTKHHHDDETVAPLRVGTELPGGIVGIFLILLLPSTASVVYIFATASASASGATAILVIVAAIGCILFLGPIIAVAYHVLRNVDVLVECHSAEDDTMDSLQLQWSNSWSARARRLLRWLTYHRSHWSARAGASGRAASDFALRYGQVFGVYNGRHRRFFIVEFGVVLCSGVVLGAALSAADACAAVVWGGVLLAALSGGLGAAHAVLLPTTARIESVSIALVASLTCAAELALAFTDSAAGERLMIAAAVLELVLVCVGIMLDVLPRNYFLISAATKVFKPQQIKPETRKSRRRRHDMSPGRPCLREQQNQLPLAGGRLARHQCEILKILIMAASASARLPPRATPLENEGTVQKDQQGHATAAAAAAAVNALLRYSQRQKRHQSA